MAGKVLDIRGYDETQELLSSFMSGELQNRVRRGTRAGAKVMRTDLRKRAQDPKYPSSFRKTKTRGHRTPVGTSTGPNSPLLNIFEPGAKAHPIGGGGQLLHSQQGVSPVFAARGPVQHPGMDARPIIGPTFDATHDEAAKAAIDVIFAEHPRPVGLDG